MNADEVPKGALDGLTVIDLTMMLACPYAAMMLADQGARVVKIEPPDGDVSRRIGPHPDGGLMSEDGGYGAYFASIGRNKESIAVDLKQEAGKQVLRRLVAKADVIWRISAPASSRLTIGIDYELPRVGVWRALGWTLAGAYSRWRLTSMVEGGKLDLERKGTTP